MIHVTKPKIKNKRVNMWTVWKTNPRWQKYNDFMNEEGEGYNPHPRYIRCSVEKKEIFPGKFYTVGEATDLLTQLRDSLPKHTDPSKIKRCQEWIAVLESHLSPITPDSESM